MQPSHVWRNAPLVTVAGDQLSKNPAGNVVSEEQFCHAYPNLFDDEISIRGKEVRDEQPSHAANVSKEFPKSRDGKEVREEQARHA